MTEFKIKKVTLDDIDQLQKIGRQTFYETFSAGNTEENMTKYLNEGFSIDKLTIELNDKNAEFYFATFNNTIIGYLKLNFGQSQTELQDDKGLEIERIYVLKDFHGKSVGQLLYDKAIEVAKQKNSIFECSELREAYHILEIGTRILERKYTAKLEDLITDIFTDHLRSKGYQITDQTRSGIARVNPGELDIMVRNTRNMPISIVEALKITSIGLGNTTVIDHINKLFLSYDTNGLPRNFILVYCKTTDFSKTWSN